MKNLNIKVLSDIIANRIAAGEVVERPAAVIKELVENAIDADAKSIDVEIKQAGLAYIRITDDGQGMLPPDARLAFERHATSKISSEQDLEHISTLGFRGEALPSIASVARVELKTGPADQAAGYMIKIEGGQVLAEMETGCAPGTTVLVRDLFYNTPARRKFLKSQATEQAHCVQAVEAAALAHLDIRFTLIVDQREILNCPAAPALPDRLSALYGRALPNELLALEREAGGIWIRGMIAGPGDHRHTRQGMRFFINHRPVEHRGLSHAVIAAYQNLLPHGRFPLCYLFLTMPPHLVDVNVHPAKREVRLRDEHGIHNVVLDTIRNALKGSDLSGGRAQEAILKGTGQASAPETYAQKPLTLGWSAGRVREAVASYLTPGSRGTTPAEPASAQEQVAEAELRIIGQVGRTYIAAQDQEGFFLVDQHAAHERILYEALIRHQGELPRQSLLLPLTFELSPAQSGLLKNYFDFFKRIGLEISPFGGNSFTIQTQPEAHVQGDLIALVREVLEWLEEHGKIDEETLKKEALQRIACKNAVKAGDRLQPESMLALIQDARDLGTLPTCPHGRPFIFRLTWQDLDRIFKRDYPD